MNMIELFLKMNGPILFFVILFVQSFYINSQWLEVIVNIKTMQENL